MQNLIITTYRINYPSESYVAIYTHEEGKTFYIQAEFMLYKFGKLIKQWKEKAESGLHENDPLAGQKEPALALQKSISAFNMQQQISKTLDQQKSS